MDNWSSDLEMSHFSSTSTPGESDEDYGGHSRIRIEKPIESPIMEVRVTANTANTSYSHGADDSPISTVPMSSFAEERMRRKLFFFFMNPIEKWQTRRRFPYKFLVQLIKIVLVSETSYALPVI